MRAVPAHREGSSGRACGARLRALRARGKLPRLALPQRRAHLPPERVEGREAPGAVGGVCGCAGGHRLQQETDAGHQVRRVVVCQSAGARGIGHGLKQRGDVGDDGLGHGGGRVTQVPQQRRQHRQSGVLGSVGGHTSALSPSGDLQEEYRDGKRSGGERG